jgi:hypothetical protein
MLLDILTFAGSMPGARRRAKRDGILIQYARDKESTGRRQVK